jgi:hypothetical protein
MADQDTLHAAQAAQVAQLAALGFTLFTPLGWASLSGMPGVLLPLGGAVAPSSCPAPAPPSAALQERRTYAAAHSVSASTPLGNVATAALWPCGPPRVRCADCALFWHLFFS